MHESTNGKLIVTALAVVAVFVLCFGFLFRSADATQNGNTAAVNPWAEQRQVMREAMQMARESQQMARQDMALRMREIEAMEGGYDEYDEFSEYGYGN